jgi:hypothetical protein
MNGSSAYVNDALRADRACVQNEVREVDPHAER